MSHKLNENKPLSTILTNIEKSVARMTIGKPSGDVKRKIKNTSMKKNVPIKLLPSKTLSSLSKTLKEQLFKLEGREDSEQKAKTRSRRGGSRKTKKYRSRK